jgi:hypothetical protein
MAQCMASYYRRARSVAKGFGGTRRTRRLKQMTGKPAIPRVGQAADRRAGVDRRKEDLPRPGLPERRRSVESRKPDVREIEMSNSDWARLDSAAPPPPPKKK